MFQCHIVTHVVQKAFFRHAMAAVKNKAAGAGRVISRGYLSVAEQEKYGGVHSNEKCEGNEEKSRSRCGSNGDGHGNDDGTVCQCMRQKRDLDMSTAYPGVQ